MPNDTLPDAVVEEIARAMTDPVTVTQADRDAAAAIFPAFLASMKGEENGHSLSQSFACHRQAGVQQGLDMAAGVADDCQRDRNSRAYEQRQAGKDDNFNCAAASTASHIAAEIRKLGGDDGSD